MSASTKKNKEKKKKINYMKKLKASFGTMKSKAQIPDEALRRENMYGDNGR